MPTATQQIESPENKGLNDLQNILGSQEGRSLLRKALSQADRPAARPAHTPEEIEKFYKMAEKEDVIYVRIDPKTKQVLAEAEEFIWKIISATNAMSGACTIKEFGHPRGELRVDFQIQKFYREKMVRKSKDKRADPALQLAEDDSILTHEAWCLREPDGAIIETGDRMIDASDFMEQFKAE